eukprot:TRINITY_DN68_c0_g1_i11.p2 TRINITY_DN68_c0_g1~~TRINITY_DN68_c0_g1_i11.p2  ORF type:complete len:140 (-),score=1.88 TRINITY_DN68_c0_g1_i11:228-647(-)
MCTRTCSKMYQQNYVKRQDNCNFFFFNDTATTEIYTEQIVGSVRCVQETDTEPETRSDTTPREDTGEELNSVSTKQLDTMQYLRGLHVFFHISIQTSFASLLSLWSMRFQRRVSQPDHKEKNTKCTLLSSYVKHTKENC